MTFRSSWGDACVTGCIFHWADTTTAAGTFYRNVEVVVAFRRLSSLRGQLPRG